MKYFSTHFRALALRQWTIARNVRFIALNGGQFTLSTQLIILNYPMQHSPVILIKWRYQVGLFKLRINKHDWPVKYTTTVQRDLDVQSPIRHGPQQVILMFQSDSSGLEKKASQPFTLRSDKDNFSSQYQYNLKQTSDKNKRKYQSGDDKLIQYQILQNL